MGFVLKMSGMVWNGLGLKAGERLGLKESWASVTVWAETCLKWMRKEGTFPGWFSGWVAKRLFSLPKPWEWGRKSARTVGILFLGFHNGCSYRGEWRWFVYTWAGPKPFVFIYHWTLHRALDMGLLVPSALGRPWVHNVQSTYLTTWGTRNS